MKTKNLAVFFLAIASLLSLVATASAFTTDIATIDSVEINGIQDLGVEDISVIAGETVTVKVSFTAIETAADVRIKAELEGVKVDEDAQTASFNIEAGMRYVKTLTLKVPYELQDEVSEDMALNVKIWNGDFKTEYPEITLRVQRPSYNAEVMSISSSQTVAAGELYPVDIVIKNVGYNRLDDLYVTAKISALGVERTFYYGDLVSIETDDDDDYESRRFYLEIPYGVEEGIYTLEVEATNSDLTVSDAKQIVIENDFASNVIVTETKKSVAVGEEAQFEILVANPTNKLKVYRIVAESSGDLSTSSNVVLVSVPAGTSKGVTVTAVADSEGEYNFNVVVLSGEEVVETVALSLEANGSSVNGSVIALTIILSIIFIVLLVVLVMLLRKKPTEQADEFGESYY